MKKSRKKLLKVVAIAFMIIGISTTALAAGGYITWNGSTDFHEAMENLNLIGERGNILKSERDRENATNEQLQNVMKYKENVIKDKENVIKDKDNLISAKDQEIAAKEQEIENLKNQGTGNNEQLKQAEKDMRDVNNKTKEILNGLN